MTNEKALTLAADDVTEENALEVIEALRGERIPLKEAAARYARRELAIRKDIARKKAGEHASRFYRGDAHALAPSIRKTVAPALASVDESRESVTAPRVEKVTTPKVEKVTTPKVEKVKSTRRPGIATAKQGPTLHVKGAQVVGKVA